MNYDIIKGNKSKALSKSSGVNWPAIISKKSKVIGKNWRDNCETLNCRKNECTLLRRYNMKRVTTTFVASLTMLALACPIYAANEKKMTANTLQPVGASQAQSAEDIKVFQVFSQTGEKIGEISEFRTDKQSGEVQFVTLATGGVIGINGKDIAVPLGFKLDRRE